MVAVAPYDVDPLPGKDHGGIAYRCGAYMSGGPWKRHGGAFIRAACGGTPAFLTKGTRSQASAQKKARCGGSSICAAAARAVGQVRMGRDMRPDFRLNRLGKQLTSPGSQNIRQRIVRKRPWLA